MSSPIGRSEAIVRPRAGARAFDVERIAPDRSLAEFVDYYWLVRWRVQRPHRQHIVSQPRVHLAAESGRLFVHGVNPRLFVRTLTGAGHVLGAAFHAGGFRPLLRANASGISATVRPALDVLGADDRPVAGRILGTTTTTEMVRFLDSYLLALSPEPDPIGRQVTALVHEVERSTDMVRAEQVAKHAGLSLRSLQRLFADYVGIGPKWVVQRARILDATAVAHAGAPVDWSALAAELGFSDQSHLTRVFTAVVGTSPARYHRDPDTV